MKRIIIAMILTTVLAFSTSVVFASEAGSSGVDLKSLSDDQIVALLKEVNQEVMDRKIEKKAEITPGEYTAGRDLPVGKYDFFSAADNENLGQITVKRADENDKFLWENEANDKDFQYQFELKEGDVLTVTRTGTLTMATSGIKFE